MLSTLSIKQHPPHYPCRQTQHKYWGPRLQSTCMVTLRILQSCAGTVPSIEVPYKSKYSNHVREPSSKGTVPTKALTVQKGPNLSTLSKHQVLTAQSVPVKALESSDDRVNAVKEPTSDGSVPVKHSHQMTNRSNRSKCSTNQLLTAQLP
jgi:hypothetical protein